MIGTLFIIRSGQNSFGIQQGKKTLLQDARMPLAFGRREGFIKRIVNSEPDAEDFDLLKTMKQDLSAPVSTQSIYDAYKAHIDAKIEALPRYGKPCTKHPVYAGEFGYELQGIVPWYYDEHRLDESQADPDADSEMKQSGKQET